MFQAALKLILTLLSIVIPLGITTYYILDTTTKVKTTNYYRVGFATSVKDVKDPKGDSISLGVPDFWVTFSSEVPVEPKNFESYKETSCDSLIEWFKATLSSYDKGFNPFYNLKKELKALNSDHVTKCYKNKYKQLGYISEEWFVQIDNYNFYRSWEYNQ